MSYDRRRLRRLEWLGMVRLLQNGRLSEPLSWYYNQNGRDSGVHGFVQHYWTTSLFERFLVAHFNVRGQRAWERYRTFAQLDGTDLYMTGRDSRGRAARAASIAFFQGRDEVSGERLRAIVRILCRAGRADLFNSMLPCARGPPVEFDGRNVVEMNDVQDMVIAGDFDILWAVGDGSGSLEDVVLRSESMVEVHGELRQWTWSSVGDVGDGSSSPSSADDSASVVSWL